MASLCRGHRVCRKCARSPSRRVLHDPVDPQPLRLFADTAASEIDLRPILEELDAWQNEGIEVITVLDARYPLNLRTIHNRPPLLFVHGALRDSDDSSIAVVGTRAASPSGLALTDSIAGEIAESGYVIVSGLAAGIDTAAHHAALSRGRRTIAVIGTGVRRAYPRENADLQERLATATAVVSQFWPDAPPTKHSFPMRNIVMSGLTLATVVIEASRTSGARMQARFALEHGRRCFSLNPCSNMNGPSDTRSGRAHSSSAQLMRSSTRSSITVRSTRFQSEGRRGMAHGDRSRTQRPVRQLHGQSARTGCRRRVRNVPNLHAGIPTVRCLQPGSLEFADAVLPISYSTHLGQLHTALANYKRSASATIARRAQLELAAVLWRFLAYHEECIRVRLDIDPFELVTTVPSGAGEQISAHPLREIVGSLVAPTRGPADETDLCFALQAWRFHRVW